MRGGLVFALAALALAGGCVAPVGPVAVTRFHVPDYPAASLGTITVVAAPGTDTASPELRSWREAVGQELSRLGYRVVTPADAAGPAQVAEVAVERVVRERPAQPRVALNGGAGSFGSGVGLGIAIPLGSNRPPVTTTLAVRIRELPAGRALWEGRASFTAQPTSPMADSQLGAAKLAAALFAGFPGNSGETIAVP